MGRALVERNFAACADLLPSRTAIYRWESRTNDGAECAFLTKTTAATFESLRALVRELHRDALPCIVAFPIEEGNAQFLDWIRRTVRGG